MFAGIGAQSKALENLGVDFEHYYICEIDRFAIASYNAIHNTNFKTSDITKVHASDIHICDTDKYCYIMTYSFPCQDLSNAGKQAGMRRGGGQDQDCFGKWKEYSTKRRNFLKYCLWRMFPKFTAKRILRILMTG
jgi:site-specific DNA-cytosine methylase